MKEKRKPCHVCHWFQFKPEKMPNIEYEDMIWEHLRVHEKYGENIWADYPEI